MSHSGLSDSESTYKYVIMELVLNTFGASLSRDNGGFTVCHKDGKQRIPADGVKTIRICKGVQITSDAVLLAIEKEIEILFMDKTGYPAGRIWSPKYGSISTIRKGQLIFCSSSEAVSWIKETVQKKIENQQAYLLMLDDGSSTVNTNIINKSIHRLEEYRRKIGILEGVFVSDVASSIRGWEGIASKIYFDTINLFIPEKYRFERRSQRPALDISNAMLNYAYGMLYSRIEGYLINAGIDPYIGVLHRDDYNRPVLVYDVIERYRIWADYIVFSILRQDIINEDYYSQKEDGACWLESLGRRIVIQSFNDYLEEVIEVDRVQRSRGTHIMLYTQRLAQLFKKLI